MNNTINYLEENNIPTDSYIQAQKILSENGVLSDHDYLDILEEMYDDIDVRRESFVPRLMFGYTVQEAIRSYASGSSMTNDELYTLCLKRSTELAEKFVNVEREQTSRPVDINGNPKPKKGVKKEKALKLWNSVADKSSMSRKEWIAKLVDMVGLTPAGASTYYANLKSNLYS